MGVYGGIGVRQQSYKSHETIGAVNGAANYSKLVMGVGVRD
jgi:hypothetical protein